MKRVLPFALAALLLLSACRAPAADSPAPVNPPSPAVTDGGNPDGRYLFYEGFFLGCVQFFWNLNDKLDDMCSTDVFISKGRNTFSFQTDGCICLCSWF